MAMDRVAVVAGGSAGVGRAVVSALLETGYKVAVCARGEERLAAMRGEIGAERLLARSVDVADAAAVEAFAAEVVDAFGAPSVWVNSAMLTAFSPFREMPPEEFERIVAATFLGQVNGVRAALRVMESGRIVNIGSGLAYRPVPFQSAYCAAKHAINGFTGSIASELMREGSGVSLALVQLPAVNTPQFTWARNRMAKKPQPAPPIYAPDVAAKAVMKAAEGNAREIFVGKSVMQLVFGTMVLPAWLDKKLADEGVETQKSDEAEPGGREDNLESPAEHPATVEGRFGDRAASDGWIVDADLVRKVVFFGVPAVAFLVGLVLG